MTPSLTCEPLDRAVTSVRGALGETAGPPPSLERPKHLGQGDYATNAAMLLAPSLGAAPRTVAERLGAALGAELGGDLATLDIAGPGFST